jgi:phosphate transport system substrate-binding protein
LPAGPRISDVLSLSAVLRTTKFTVMSLVAALSVAAADLRMVGTDLLGVEVSQALYRFSGRANLLLALALDGSRPGLDQLKSGRADLALLVLTPEENAATEGLESITLGYQVVVVLASAAVPLEQMTLAQLRDVFGESGPRSANRWVDLGVDGAFSAAAIGPQIPAVGQGIAVEFFRHAVLKDRPFNATVSRYGTVAELKLRLTGERQGLALAAMRPPNLPGLKIVRVAAKANDPAYSPTPENVHSGDYPLALPLRIVFRREAAARLRPLLRFLLSDELAPVLEQAQVIPLAPAARQRQLVALEKP